MKKRLCYYVLSTLMGVIFYSCPSDDEVYSCDPDADEWVKENVKEVRSMSRDNWITINDDVLKRAIYSAFTPEQKRKFWNDKLDKIYSLSLYIIIEKGANFYLKSIPFRKDFEGNKNA